MNIIIKWHLLGGYSMYILTTSSCVEIKKKIKIEVLILLLDFEKL